MELPQALRAGVDHILESVPLNDLRTASGALTARYRAEIRDGRQHLDGERAMNAYLAARLPATYAAVRAAMSSTAEIMPDYRPTSLLDIGAGPGTCVWSTGDCWPSLREATLIEASRPAIATGIRLCRGLNGTVNIRWLERDIRAGISDAGPADLVTVAYVLDELEPREAVALVERLWASTRGLLLIVEPGTPAGYRRILDARTILLGLGGFVAAPCPHEMLCPLKAPDWCHFAQRVSRSRIHRLAKHAEVPWEDEKYSFVAVSRTAPAHRASRVLAQPALASGRAILKLCDMDGQAKYAAFSRRQGEIFKRARRASWGDAFPSGTEQSATAVDAGTPG